MLSTVLLRLGGHIEEALHAAEQAVAAAPDSVPAHLQLGLLLSAADNSMRAVQELSRTVELDPGNYEAWSTLATTYSKLHEDSKSQECANKAADLEPTTRTVRLRMLHNLEHAGKVAEAKAELKRLVNNSEFSPEFLEQLAGEAIEIGDWDDALVAGNKVAEAYPKATAPLKLMAIAQFNGRNYQDSLKSARRMQELDAQSAEARALQGRALLKLGSAEQAEKEVEESLSRQPELPLGQLAQGELDFSRGKYAAASEHLSSSIEGDPALGKVPEICFMLAQALEKQGEHENSLSYYKKSLAHGLSGDDAGSAREAIARLGGTGK
jgi:Flp pilus assembly protein TadD